MSAAAAVHARLAAVSLLLGLYASRHFLLHQLSLKFQALHELSAFLCILLSLLLVLAALKPTSRPSSCSSTPRPPVAAPYASFNSLIPADIFYDVRDQVHDTDEGSSCYDYDIGSAPSICEDTVESSPSLQEFSSASKAIICTESTASTPIVLELVNSPSCLLNELAGDATVDIISCISQATNIPNCQARLAVADALQVEEQPTESALADEVAEAALPKRASKKIVCSIRPYIGEYKDRSLVLPYCTYDMAERLHIDIPSMAKDRLSRDDANKRFTEFCTRTWAKIRGE